MLHAGIVRELCVETVKGLESDGTSVSVSDELPSWLSDFPKRRAADPSLTKADDQEKSDCFMDLVSDSPEIDESIIGLVAIAAIYQKESSLSDNDGDFVIWIAAC